MGYEMTEGTVARWLKAEGDQIRSGEPIAEVETDKAVVELDAPAGGTLLRITAPQGSSVPVGDVLAYIGEPGETVPDTLAPPSTAPRPQALAADEAPRGLRTGFPPRTPGPDGTIPLGRMGEAIARRTQRTAQEAPHFYLTVRIDMTAAMEFRRELNQGASGVRTSLNDLIIKAVGLALRKHPVYNSTFAGDHLRVHEHVNVGMAIALPGGLVVPAILDCDTKTLQEIASAARDLNERVRNGVLQPEEYTGTFSISNLGMYAVDEFSAVIVSPGVGVLAVGSIQQTPVVSGAEIVVRQVMSATLSTDHRAANGAEAAQFAGEIKRLLEEPASLT